MTGDIASPSKWRRFETFRASEIYRALSSTAQAMLFLLVDHANDAGVSWHGVETLATQTGKSIGTVKRALAELVEARIIQRQRRRDRSTLTTVAFLGQNPEQRADAPSRERADAPKESLSVNRKDDNAALDSSASPSATPPALAERVRWMEEICVERKTAIDIAADDRIIDAELRYLIDRARRRAAGDPKPDGRRTRKWDGRPPAAYFVKLVRDRRAELDANEFGEPVESSPRANVVDAESTL